MRYSINSHAISPKKKGWGNGWPTDRWHDMARVKADRTATGFNVHKRIARLIDMLIDETERRGYQLDKKQCGGYNNRAKKSGGASNHSWGLAVDLNWHRNPERWDGVLRTDLPSWLPRLWGRYGFFWGGHYKGDHRDPMHLEFMGSPDDADDMTAKARKELKGAPVVTAKVAVHTYTVQGGDSLSLIATRLKVHGGWQALYAANKKVIGPDPNKIKPGQVLNLP